MAAGSKTSRFFCELLCNGKNMRSVRGWREQTR
jgi:hypothetical protein